MVNISVIQIKFDKVTKILNLKAKIIVKLIKYKLLTSLNDKTRSQKN